MKVNPIDWSLTPVDPDPNFSPEHNQKVIDEVIRAGEVMGARKQRESDEGVKERSGAIARYLKSLDDGKTNSTVAQYFGRHELARLRGKEILNRLQWSDLGEKMKAKLKKTVKHARLTHEYGSAQE